MLLDIIDPDLANDAVALRRKLGDGVFFVDDLKCELIFKPAGSTHGDGTFVVAKMAIGGTAHWLPEIVARFLNSVMETAGECKG